MEINGSLIFFRDILTKALDYWGITSSHWVLYDFSGIQLELNAKIFEHYPFQFDFFMMKFDLFNNVIDPSNSNPTSSLISTFSREVAFDNSRNIVLLYATKESLLQWITSQPGNRIFLLHVTSFSHFKILHNFFVMLTKE